jgi:GNAT superfamily N-acetyltransferase
MIGDINLFLKGSSSHRRVNNVSSSSPGAELDEEEELEAEIEIMIAERTYRKKGLAREALQAFLEYAAGFAGTFAGKTTNAQTQKGPRVIPYPSSPSRLTLSATSHICILQS